MQIGSGVIISAKLTFEFLVDSRIDLIIDREVIFPRTFSFL